MPSATPSRASVKLIMPNAGKLPGLIGALQRGWTPDDDHDPVGAGRMLAAIARDPAAYIASLGNPQGGGQAVVLEDGRAVPRLPWLRYWIIDAQNQYAGDLNLRWQHGASALPPYCLGHVGYAVVPWKRGAGLAAAALRELAPIARDLGLEWLDIAMARDNAASIRTAENAGAKRVRPFNAGPEYGNVEAWLYRLQLDAHPACGDKRL
ncbi:GNAT family N-acetyltransferase [Chromobacterium sinusclupearum]|uniref:GNAT family N-acetyltransferase n=1 Tax=Chromobacterium sinusclupearum TaxID=2077146 RepID=A0A2K4MKP2_9NEIS|nr:GNAT family N-acetyltransferase [Chromobacterium sinusclupearum]POA97633.1 GNAT family N-acetyltransferase [Chromobacterium sinusclupearum]